MSLVVILEAVNSNKSVFQENDIQEALAREQFALLKDLAGKVGSTVTAKLGIVDKILGWLNVKQWRLVRIPDQDSQKKYVYVDVKPLLKRSVEQRFHGVYFLKHGWFESIFRTTTVNTQGVAQWLWNEIVESERNKNAYAQGVEAMKQRQREELENPWNS